MLNYYTPIELVETTGSHNVFITISFKGYGDDSSIEEESTLMDKNRRWSEKYSHQGSSSDLSTSSEFQLNSRGEKYYVFQLTSNQAPAKFN